MRDALDARPVRGKAPGDQYDRMLDEELEASGSNELAVMSTHPLDTPAARAELRQLMSWYYSEREIQSVNRMEMAMDADFYDGLQWRAEDKAAVEARGQMALVYNEVAPLCDWLIGTERRTRVDWKVLPRTEDDVQIADIKTKVLKYVSDINRVVFNRSRAFADSVKVGVGWQDDGARDDPTKDVLYSKYEDWRNVLWDSRGSYELDLDDARYLFRWRWVDVDIGVMMFPDRADAVRKAAEDTSFWGDVDPEEEDGWQSPLDAENRSGTLRAYGSGTTIDTERRRVRLIEAQYRIPTKVRVVRDGPHSGAILNDGDQLLADAVAQSGSMIVDRMMMRTHVAVFVEGALLSRGPSIARHNKFSLTPTWCYRFGRTRQPYGVVRRVRDVQMDLNKRASKALFLMNSNQVIMDEGAVEDIEATRDEVGRPDGMIIKKANKAFEIRRDVDAATGQIQMMELGAQSIQRSAGVNNENLGRQTNAVSGAAIERRQIQGSVSTTEPFDNLRFSTQVQGEKQLSLTEQFYTDAKVIRLTGAKGTIEWLRINQPEQQADGSVRYLNDITASIADFIVTEADYAGTLRQVMFDSLMQISQRLPPEVALRLLTLAFEFSDLPNKDEIADQIRKMTGDRDPNKEPTPEEQAAMQAQQVQQAEALQYQRETAIAALEEHRAKVREINARAAKLETEAAGAADGEGIDPALEQALGQIRQQAAQQIEQLSEELRKAQAELTNRTLQIRQDADVKLEVANIERDTKLRVAEIQAASDKRVAVLEARLAAIEERSSAQDARGEKAATAA